MPCWGKSVVLFSSFCGFAALSLCESSFKAEFAAPCSSTPSPCVMSAKSCASNSSGASSLAALSSFWLAFKALSPAGSLVLAGSWLCMLAKISSAMSLLSAVSPLGAMELKSKSPALKSTGVISSSSFGFSDSALWAFSSVLGSSLAEFWVVVAVLSFSSPAFSAFSPVMSCK